MVVGIDRRQCGKESFGGGQQATAIFSAVSFFTALAAKSLIAGVRSKIALPGSFAARSDVLSQKLLPP